MLLLPTPPARPAGARPAHRALAGRSTVPTLILEGESDPFARIELLRGAMPLLAQGRLVTYPRLGHGLVPVLDQALDALVSLARRCGVDPA